MAVSNSRATLLLGIVVIIMTLISQASYNEAISGLSYDYYKQTCPHLEDIVQKEVERIYYIHGNAVVSFTKNIFHDCVIQVTVIKLRGESMRNIERSRICE